MPSLTIDKFDQGLDLRKGKSVADVNRLRDLTNAYVTTGKVVRKRPGLSLVATLEAGTKGLVAGNGVLNTFYESGSITHANGLFTANLVAHPTLSQAVSRVHHGDMFLGYIYVAVEYADGSIWHHYLDGNNPTHIADANCPQTAAWVKAASKIWAVDGDVVRFSATSLPRDWTTANDASFLPTGLQDAGTDNARALGLHGRDLVTLFDDSAQIWVPDPEPALHVFRKPIRNIGTPYPGSLAHVSDDLLFLSKAGYRSIGAQGATDNLTDLDVGTPIDSIVTPLLVGGINPIAAYYAGGGQYWCAIGNTVHAFTFSRTDKVRAWSKYTLAVTPDALAVLNGELYIREGDKVYLVDDAVFTDNGTQYEMRVELPFINFKKPGYLKQIYGVDAVVEGDVNIQFKWDPNDDTAITDPVPLSGDTKLGALTPVEIISTQIAPVLTSTSAEDVRIDALTLHYELLGMV